MSNYREKATAFVDHVSGLDPDIQEALSAYLHINRPNVQHVSEVSITPLLSAMPKSIDHNTDVMQFHLATPDATHPVDTIDLASLTTSEIKGLEAIVFTSDTNVSLNLASFSGAVILGDGNNSVVATEEVAIQVGSGNDTVTTGAGDDTVMTGAGDDRIFTHDGKDLVRTGLGNDSVDSGTGNDTVFTGGGNDSITLGEGDDKVVIEARNGDVVHVDGGKGDDIMDLVGTRIESVSKIATAGPDFGYYQITVDTGGGGHATVVLTNVEQFIYDANGSAAGGVVNVDIAKLDHDF